MKTYRVERLGKHNTFNFILHRDTHYKYMHKAIIVWLGKPVKYAGRVGSWSKW